MINILSISLLERRGVIDSIERINLCGPSCDRYEDGMTSAVDFLYTSISTLSVKSRHHTIEPGYSTLITFLSFSIFLPEIISLIFQFPRGQSTFISPSLRQIRLLDSIGSFSSSGMILISDDCSYAFRRKLSPYEKA